MSNIYDLHDKAFSQVSAYILMNDNKQIGTISLKYPKDGAGRLYCYIHLIGDEMVRGFAGGYGYDKQTAAFEDAINKLKCENPENKAIHAHLNNLMKNSNGKYWYRVLGKYNRKENKNTYILRAI